MKPYFESKYSKLYHGNCLDILKELPPNSVDSIITDPPYALEFMGKGWDKVLPAKEIWAECLRVAKPGSMLLAFGGTRTYHRLTCAIEDAGWVIRDCLMWIYGSGFPKSHDISKGIDKRAGAKREVVGYKKLNERDKRTYIPNGKEQMFEGLVQGERKMQLTAPATPEAQTWDGYGTALKPAYEPILLAMKPLNGTFAENALKWGVAGLWIDGGRIVLNGDYKCGATGRPSQTGLDDNYNSEGANIHSEQGRWPANVILDEEAGRLLDEQSGKRKAGGIVKGSEQSRTGQNGIYGIWDRVANKPFKDTGGASRFFYCAKASKSERGEGNNHPTVKPLKLMEYFCKLTMTPGGGTVLDPFMGSGTTGIACRRLGRVFIGIEKDLEYCEIAAKRIEKETRQLKLWK